MKQLIALVALAVAGFVAAGSMVASGTNTPTTTTTTGGHTPVTICHKPGTPAEQELTVDDDAEALGHLAHGDTRGPCPTDTTTTETTDTQPTETEPTTPTETTPTTPEVPCGGRGLPDPPGGKDGMPGNDDCVEDPKEPPLIVDTTPTTPTTPVPPPVTTGETTTGEEPAVEEEPESGENGTQKPPKAQARPPKPRGTPKAAPPVCRPGAVETKACGVQGSG